MSFWPGKYVIGLTGNIATGKSVVRRMLEHLGAYGIDADALAHRVIAKDAPGYHRVIETFGTWIIDSDGQIERSRLAKIVFSDPKALSQLEEIVHPFVGQGIDVLIRRAKQKVIVVEAIKLIEAGLRDKCDTLWVTYAPAEIQLKRLMAKRKMSEAAARRRVNAQPHQEEKIGLADIVIKNSGSFEATWKQVVSSWERTFPQVERAPVAVVEPFRSELHVERGRPRQAAEIAAFISRLSHGMRNLTRSDVMAAFGEKAFLLLRQDEKLVGLVGWQVENLIARVDDIYIEINQPFPKSAALLMGEVERASRELQCEVALVFVPQSLALKAPVWRALKYEERLVPSLGVRAWQEAALESMKPGTVMLFKQLRRDRVLKPV